MTVKKEGSTTAAIKGFSAPLGTKIVRRKQKVDKNMSKPYGEPELFENLVEFCELFNKKLQETVRKRGNRWVYFDDKTGNQMGSFEHRKDAWDKQRQRRKTQSAAARVKKPARTKKKDGVQVDPGAETAPKVKKAPKAHKEAIMNIFRKLLNERSMISYVFEQSPTPKDTVTWENFMSKLSRETVMSDPKLRQIVHDMAKSEAKILGDAVKSVKGILEGTGSFIVEQGKLDQDPQDQSVILNFSVKMNDNKKKLNFAIKVENGRPLILFPDETRNDLNTMSNDESKLLRAELMHAQETVLDTMEEVVTATAARDAYLKEIEEKIDAVLSNMGSLEISMLRHLMKQKFKGVK